MRYGMVIDLDKCIGCQTCMVVCKMHNSQPPGVWWNRVFTQGAETHQSTVVADGKYKMDYLPVSCQMCGKPACEGACPTGATYTNADGVVLIDYNYCIGCRCCIVACPYGVRQFNWTDPAQEKERLGYVYGYPDDVTDSGKHLVYTRNRPVGSVEKCTFCAQYVQKGEQPACVRSCTGKARFFGDLDDPDSPASRLLREKPAHRLLAGQGTEPKVYYVSTEETAIGWKEQK